MIPLEEEFLSSLLLSLKELAGMSQITAMLNPTSMEKVKAAHISAIPAALVGLLNSMNIALEAAEDVLLKAEVEDIAQVIPFSRIAEPSSLMMTMIATVVMLRIMPDFLSFKYLEEVLVANASQEPSILEVQPVLLLSASNIPVLEVVQTPKLKF